MRYAEKYAHLEAWLKAIADAHREHGYRRATTELREMYEHLVNRKVVAGLHRLWDQPLRRARGAKPSASRRALDAAGQRAKLLSRRDKSEIGMLEVLYTDFTELRFAGGVRKAWPIPLLDHATRYVLGFAVGERANSGLTLDSTPELQPSTPTPSATMDLRFSKVIGIARNHRSACRNRWSASSEYAPKIVKRFRQVLDELVKQGTILREGSLLRVPDDAKAGSPSLSG